MIRGGKLLSSVSNFFHSLSTLTLVPALGIYARPVGVRETHLPLRVPDFVRLILSTDLPDTTLLTLGPVDGFRRVAPLISRLSLRYPLVCLSGGYPSLLSRNKSDGCQPTSLTVTIDW